MSRVIAITGASGYLGQHLIPYLFQSIPNVDHFIALDIKKIDFSSEIPYTFYKIDVRDEFSAILEKHGVTDLLHLAWNLKPVHNTKKAFQVYIGGTINTLHQAVNAKVEYFLHSSSTLAYGAHPDNNCPLTESDPLRGNKNFHYSFHKVQAEKEINKFLVNHPCALKIGIIRPAPILSSDLKSYVRGVLSGGWRTLFLMPYPDGKTPVQFLHLEDALQGFGIMLNQRLEGAFNVSPDLDVEVGLIPGILEGRGIHVPLRILKPLLWLQWKLYLGWAPPGYLDFVAYPFVASNQKIKSYGFIPNFSTKETLLSLKKGVNNR
ncbi:MAG: NAD-dependent epimerase/dehydratase family protein [Candidatus Hodarchaeales archaeon]